MTATTIADIISQLEPGSSGHHLADIAVTQNALIYAMEYCFMLLFSFV
ncbi:hypothetical protein [Alteromonas sp. C1M14]|nr:hypothetical protein [Alteromonas sp. C1M14]MBU2976987.1 hypothetical protein [Alteromonas sp. C1M14]